MKSLLCSLLVMSAFHAFSQSCPPNMDFEAGNFSGWNCFTGYTFDSSGVNVIRLNPSPPTTGRHEIISATSTDSVDYYGKFPTLCPYAGNYSVKLGNNLTGGEAEGLSYTFQIPPLDDTFSLTYFYAVVFEDPGHAPPEQPRFFVTAYDVATGYVIDCASYNYISTASIPGFQRSTEDSTVLFKNWTPASIDFSGLGGRTVRLEFKTGDCTLSGHFGYAYVDVGNGCGGLITVAALCGATNSVVLNAPYGFQSYTWYNADYSTVVGTQQNSIISPAPPANSSFHVDLVPYPGFGCRDTAEALVVALPVPDTPVAVRQYTYCQYATATPLVATATRPNILSWYTSATGGIESNTPPIPSTAVAGTFRYYVSQKKLFGCESNRVEIVVTVTPTPTANFNINNLSQCLNTNDFLFTSNSTGSNSSTQYFWDFGDTTSSAASSASIHHTYTNYGIYNVKLRALNPPSCSTEVIRFVRVVGTPTVQLVYPPVICENQGGISISSNSSVPGNSGIVNQWQWKIANTTYNVQFPPPLSLSGGKLPVQLVVGTSEGCFSSPVRDTLNIHYKPQVRMKLNAICSNEITQFTDLSTIPGTAAPDVINTWDWLIDNSIVFNTKNPSLLLGAGVHNVKLVTATDIGCKSDLLDTSFTVYDKPKVQLSITDSCVNRTIRYSAANTSSNPVTTWYWNIGMGLSTGPQQLFHRFSSDGYYPVTLIGQTIHGCKDTLFRPFSIYKNHSFAGRDTLVAIDQPVQLNAGGGSTVNYAWSPSTGLSNPNIEAPVAILDRDQLYVLNSLSIYGCESYSKIFIKRYKGPELYIPTAFSPNEDGLNDVLKVFPVGMKAFYSFDVFNRFGVCLFHTTNRFQGWDGTYKGVKTDPGNYVAMVRAMDYRGNVVVKKVNVILLR